MIQIANITITPSPVEVKKSFLLAVKCVDIERVLKVKEVQNTKVKYLQTYQIKDLGGD